jgi:hypothetical protein
MTTKITVFSLRNSMYRCGLLLAVLSSMILKMQITLQ